MSEATRPDQPAGGPPPGAPQGTVPPGAAGPAPAARPALTPEQILERSRRNRALRMGWIREHSSDDRFFIFVGVAVLAGLLGFVAYKLIREYGRKPPAPIPLVELYYAARAEEIAPGIIRTFYNFDIDPKVYDLREACAQLADWESPKGTVDNSGVLVSGLYTRYRPFFAAGDLSVECDAALVYGSEIALRLSSIRPGQENDWYQLELWAGQPGGLAPRALITHWRGGAQVRASEPVTLPALEARRAPPLFYRAKFEIAGSTLRGYFQGQPAGELPADPELVPGMVMLLGPGSQTAFDNVTVAGRAHPEFVKQRSELYRLFPPAKKEAPAEEPEARDAPGGGQAQPEPAGAEPKPDQAAPAAAEPALPAPENP